MRTRFYNTLHFRIPMFFVVLLGTVFFGYYKWVENTLYDVDWAEGEEAWYDNLREAEIGSLATRLAPALEDSSRLQRLVDDYMEQIEDYDFEIVVFDTSGSVIVSSTPESLSHVLLNVNPVLLDSMSMEEWDFSRFPNPESLEAYENRINDVLPLRAGADSTAPEDAWLATSFQPVSLDMDSIEDSNRGRLLRGAASILLYSFISGLILMTWITRRIRKLSRAMGDFRRGDFESRATGTSGDELGALGRDFNLMADHITEMINSLNNAEQYRKQLVANISHDLRSPIASLRGYVEALELRGESMSPEDRSKHTKAMTTNLVNLENLISRLFELSRLESGQYEYRREDFNLVELATELIGSLEGHPEFATLHSELIVEGDLPLVHADPVRIGQVLQNLLENAIKFNKPGGRIKLILAPVPQGVEIRVEDSGIGIAPDDLPHVFERFYTADKSRHQGGTGLGLAIAHQIVEDHGSKLQVTSRKDQGTIFHFRIEAAAREDGPENAA